MSIIIPNQDAGVLPANIGTSGVLLPPSAAAAANLITLTGAVFGTGSTAILTALTPNAVTYSTIQVESASTLLGNPVNNAQSPSEITPGSGLIFSGSTLTLGNPGGFLNKFRNGQMDVAQRGASGTISAGTGAYTIDGWLISAVGANAAWAQEYNVNFPGNAMRISCASGLTSCFLTHRIESNIAAELLTYNNIAQPITVQFAIYNNSGAAITPTLLTSYPTVRDIFASTATDLTTTTLQTIANAAFGIVSYTFIPSLNIANGYEVALQFGSQLNASSGYVDISFCDLRATPGIVTGQNINPPVPETRSIWVERDFCFRYFYQTQHNGPGITAYAGGPSEGLVPSPFYYPVRMRATPTATVAFSSSTNCTPSYASADSSWGYPIYTSSAAGVTIAVLDAGSTFSAEL